MTEINIQATIDMKKSDIEKLKEDKLIVKNKITVMAIDYLIYTTEESIKNLEKILNKNG